MREMFMWSVDRGVGYSVLWFRGVCRSVFEFYGLCFSFFVN